jgi:hypothetical protein
VPWVVGLRDRALIGVMVYTFARISAVVGMQVDDYFPNGKRWWVMTAGEGTKPALARSSAGHDKPAVPLSSVNGPRAADRPGVAGNTCSNDRVKPDFLSDAWHSPWQRVPTKPRGPQRNPRCVS